MLVTTKGAGLRESIVDAVRIVGGDGDPDLLVTDAALRSGKAAPGRAVGEVLASDTAVFQIRGNHVKADPGSSLARTLLAQHPGLSETLRGYLEVANGGAIGKVVLHTSRSGMVADAVRHRADRLYHSLRLSPDRVSEAADWVAGEALEAGPANSGAAAAYLPLDHALWLGPNVTSDALHDADHGVTRPGLSTRVTLGHLGETAGLSTAHWYERSPEIDGLRNAAAELSNMIHLAADGAHSAGGRHQRVGALMRYRYQSKALLRAFDWAGFDPVRDSAKVSEMLHSSDPRDLLETLTSRIEKRYGLDHADVADLLRTGVSGNDWSDFQTTYDRLGLPSSESTQRFLNQRVPL